MEDQAQANHTRFLTGCGNLKAKSHPIRQQRRGIAIDGVSKILKLTFDQDMVLGIVIGGFGEAS
jgi:hypothetical protein